MASQPALPCPPWCKRNHETGTAGHHVTDRPIGDDGTAGWVALVMTDYGDAYQALAGHAGQMAIQLHWRLPNVSLGASSMERPLAESEQFAQEAEAFGRPDVAVLIRELAALAKENPDAT